MVLFYFTQRYKEKIGDPPGSQQQFLYNTWKPKNRNPEFYNWSNKNLLSFVIVRHPFERILSAYRDRFFINFSYSRNSKEREEQKRKEFQQAYGQQILRDYRKTEPENEKYKNTPTFREFVNFVLDQPLSKHNPHWRPAYLHCMPCHINYTIIGRL